MKNTTKLALVALCLWSVAVTAFATSAGKSYSPHKHLHKTAPDDSCDDGDFDHGGADDGE